MAGLSVFCVMTDSIQMTQVEIEKKNQSGFGLEPKRSIFGQNPVDAVIDASRSKRRMSEGDYLFSQYYWPGL